MSVTSRNPIVAFFFGLIVIGLGHLYAGEIKKFIALLSFGLGALLVFSLSGAMSNVYGYWLFIILILSLHVYSAFSASAAAERQKDYAPKPYNHPLCYVGIFLSLIFLSWMILESRATILGYAVYRIPSGSMAPTLSIGDYILVDTRYRKARVGDVVIYENKGITFARRVAALSGDSLSMSNGDIYLNGKNIGTLSAPRDRITRDYSISMAEIVIEPAKVFLLGDNRDSSNDSRFVGSVPATQICGRVTGIWFSEDLSRIGHGI